MRKTKDQDKMTIAFWSRKVTETYFKIQRTKYKSSVWIHYTNLVFYMKRKALIILLGLFVLCLCSCNNYRQQVEDLQAKLDSVEMSSTLKDSTMDVLTTTMFDIQEVIEDIKQKENILSLGNLSEAKKKTVKEEIMELKDILVTNRNKIEQLQNRLNSANAKNLRLERTIAKLDSTINVQEQNIKRLEHTVNTQKVQIAQLSQENTQIKKDLSVAQTQQAAAESKAQASAAQVVALQNENDYVYYIIDGRSGLNSKGFEIGIAPFYKLKNWPSSTYSYNRISKRNTKSINLGTDKAKVVSAHKTGYHVSGNTLYIDNADAFWSASKFLIMVDQRK